MLSISFPMKRDVIIYAIAYIAKMSPVQAGLIPASSRRDGKKGEARPYIVLVIKSVVISR